MREIKLPCFGIKVELTNDGAVTISSDLFEGFGMGDHEVTCALDGIESIILAHACAGVDITTDAYIEGIETAVQTVMDRW